MTPLAIRGRRVDGVTLDTHNRLIVGGSYLLFLGGMGALVGSTTESFPQYVSMAVKFILLPAAVVGCLLIVVTRLIGIKGE
jgi:hypothetical protein